MFRIEIYTKPDCAGCEKMKALIKGSEYESITELKTIYGRSGKPNLDFIKGKGYDSIPVVRVFNDMKEEVFVGAVPLEYLKKMIQKVEA